MVATWPRVRAIQIVRDHLLRQLVYPHTIGSAAVQLCPDGDPKVIRLLSESFLAGVKGDRARLSLQYSIGQPRFTCAGQCHQQSLEG